MAYVLTVADTDHVRNQALAGDEAAFAALVGPLIEPALHLAYSMLADRSEAEDATQDALTSAWRKLDQLRPGTPVRPWLFAIVMNRCRNIRRTHWFRMIRIANPSRGVESPDRQLEHIDLDRALISLPQRDRQALFLHFYLDLPLEEVATALRISRSAAKARIYRACHKLRPELTQEDR